MLDVAALRARLGDAQFGRELRALGSVTSTNDIAWAWADAGCPEGLVVLAEEQVQGRGRFGRVWQCPRGKGLLMSVVLRPLGAVGPGHVMAVGALAAAEAIEAVSGLQAAIRWPNDVALRGRKLAGVLVETRGSPSPCVLGIGMNVNVAQEEFPEELRETATSLLAETGRPSVVEAVAAAVLRRTEARYGDVAGGRWSEVRAGWQRRNALVGETIEVQTNGRLLRGQVVAADPLAGLTLELPGGERRLCRPESASLLLGATSGRSAEEGCPCSTQ